MPTWTASQLGRHPVLGAGDGVLMNNAEVGAMTLPQETRFLTFRVPVAAIAPLVPDVAAVVARRVPADCEALRLLVRYLEILQDTATLSTPQLQDVAATHVYDLLALALGGRTRKMARGHRGANHPVKNLLTGKVEISSQNHGFVVDLESLPSGAEPTHLSLFDKSNEGLRMIGKRRPSVCCWWRTAL